MEGKEKISIVELARNTINEYIINGKIPRPVSIDEIKETVPGKAGVFVSIKKHGNLRGCIGTFVPTKSNIVEEVIANAIAASTRDPRFNPIEEHELNDLNISVDVLSEPELVENNDLSKMDPKVYGIILECHGKRGLLLPDLEGVDTVEKQIEITRNKAWITEPLEMCKIYRFKVERYH